MFLILCVKKLTTNRHIELRERARQLVEQARREAVRRSVPQTPVQVSRNNIVLKLKNNFVEVSILYTTRIFKIIFVFKLNLFIYFLNCIFNITNQNNK